MRTLLAIGDERDWDSFKKFRRQKRHLGRGYQFRSADYCSVFDGELPEIETEDITIILFFPYEYWDCNVETKDKKTYGNREYYNKFKRFWKKIDLRIRKRYEGKNITYVNDPERIHLGRDKRRSKLMMQKDKVPVPKRYATRDTRKILGMINDGKKLFVKVRYGSMGKGITYLEKGRWSTNFMFRNKKIISKRSDYGWTFRNVTGNRDFLNALLEQDIVVEDAIDPFLVDGRRFDLRVYVAYGKVLYIYPRSNEPKAVTTNISQGARGEPQAFLKRIPPELFKRIEKSSISAAKAVGLNFAGVDVMPDNGSGHVKVLEINAFPGFPRARTFNLSKHIMKEMVRS